MAGNPLVDQMFSDLSGGNEGSVTDRMFADLPAPGPSVDDIPQPRAAIQDTRGRVDRITDNYTALVNEVAQAHGLDPRLMNGIMRTESNGNPNARSKAGAVGLFQMMPIAVDEVNRQFKTNYSHEDRLDPVKNADMGAKYFALQLQRAKGDTELALRYYNGGYDRRHWGAENAAYAGKVFENSKRPMDLGAADSVFAGEVLNNAKRYNEGGFFNSAGSALKQSLGDMTSGSYGYAKDAMGDSPAAAQSYANLQRLKDEISQSARPQDQWSGVDLTHPSEVWDFLKTTTGSALGSSAIPAVTGLAGLAAGPAAGLVAAGVPLAAQYIGNTWGGAIERGAQNGVTPEQAIEKTDAGDLIRIGGVGLARGGVELAGDIAGLAGGGVLKAAGKLLPTGKGGAAADLFSTMSPLKGIAASTGSNAAEEVVDVPLEAWGTGRPWSDVRRSELTDAAIAGAVGGGALGTAGQAITTQSGLTANGLAANVRGVLPGGADYRPNYDEFAKNREAYGLPVESEKEYLQGYYQNKGYRQATRAGQPPINTEGTLAYKARMQAEMDALAQEKEAAALAKEKADLAEKQRIPSVQEMHDRMMAEHQAALDAAKPKKVTQEDYLAARDAHLEQDPDGANIPANLQSFEAYKADAKAQAKKVEKPPAPTLADAIKKRAEMMRAPASLVYSRQLALPDQSIETALRRSAGATDPHEQEAWFNVALAREQEQNRLAATDRAPQAEPQAEPNLPPLPRNPQESTLVDTPPTRGQMDMFGAVGPTAPDYVHDDRFLTAEEADAQSQMEADPRQMTLEDYANQMGIRQKYAAAFQRAEAAMRKQKARDESDADRRTRQKNAATAQAQQAVATNEVAAEEAPDLGLKKRQVRALNKAQEAARRAQEAADVAKADARQSFIDEVNKNLGAGTLLNDDVLDEDLATGRVELFRGRNRGRLPAGLQWVQIQPGAWVKRRVENIQAAPTEQVAVAPEVQEPQAAQAAETSPGEHLKEALATHGFDQKPQPWISKLAMTPVEGLPQELNYQFSQAQKNAKRKAFLEDLAGRLDIALTAPAPKGRKAPKAKAPKSAEVDEAAVQKLISKIDSVTTKKLSDEDEALAREIEDSDYADVGDDLSGTEYGGMLGASEDYSLNEDGTAADPTDKGSVEKVVEGLTGKASHWKVHVHNTVADAEKALGRPLKKNAKAFVTGGKAHFILENIPKGSELGVFLHEAGVHLGMERILTPEQQSRLHGKLQQWAESGKGVEGEAARAAMRRADGSPKEAIAYFVEEAVNRGVNPTALDMKSDLGRWFRQLWAAMKTALRKLGIKNIDNLSAQDVVNLAYGAARLELSGNWHGSAKNFNKFSNKHRGTGEGGLKEGSDDFRDMIAFGQYFAGKRGTAEGYRDRHAASRAGGYWDLPVELQVVANHIGEYGPLIDRAVAQGLKQLTNVKLADAPEWASPVKNWIAWGDGTPLTTKEWRSLNQLAFYMSGGLDAADNQKTYNLADGISQPVLREDWEDNLKVYKDAIAKIRGVSGTLFNVDFNIKDDEWLDWDKPMVEQSEKVQSTTRSLIKDSWGDPLRMHARRAGVSPISMVSGSRLYRNLAQELGSEKTASEYLNSLGVKGVRYLDAGSRRRGEGTYNYVVFDPKNVVVGNKNSPRTESDDIQYSLNEFVDKVKPELRTKWGQAADWMSEMVVQFQGIPELARWLPHLKSLEDIHQGEKAMNEAYVDLADAANVMVERIRDLPEGVQKDLSRLMLDATMEGIHPDEDFDSEKNAHLKDDPLARANHAQLAKQFDTLPAAAKKAYADTRDLFHTMLKRRKEALVALAKEFAGSKEGEKMDRALTALSKQMPGPYFPLMRFGDHIAVWRSKEYSEAEDTNAPNLALMQKDPQHYLVSFEKTRSEADRQVKAWIQQNGLDRTDTVKSGVTVRSDFEGGVNQSLTPLLMKMESALDTTLANSEQAKEAKEAIKQVFLTSLPDNSIFKSAIKRRNVRGVKAEEMLRAIASHGGSQAFHISRLEHSHSIQKALVELRKEDRTATNEGEQLSSIHPILSRAIAGMYTQDPTTGWTQGAGALTSLIYYNRLALNPAFWITSFMSPAMLSVPYMAGRHSMVAGYRAWGRAATDAAKILTGGKLTRFSFRDQIASAKLPEDERDMLLAVERSGAIDQTALRELNNVARGDEFDDLKRVLGGAAHRVEVMSRISSALTAYRLEKKRTGDAAKATDYAVDVVNNTLINYTHAHTPLILRKGGALSGPVAKVVFQFARYQFGMLNLIGHNFRTAWTDKKASGSERTEARKQFAALMGVHALATGAGGAFGYSFLVGAANMVVGMLNPDDEPADIEKKARKMLDDLSVEISGNKNLSIALRRGLPAVAGLDLSARMGLGDILSPRRENPFKGDKAEMAAGLVGVVPGVSHLLDWVAWAQDPKLKTLPMSLVSNLAKAEELGTQGMLNKHGVVKKGPEDYNAVDLVLQGLGFPPTENTEAYANQASARMQDKAIMQTRQKLMDKWNGAMNSRNADDIAASRREIQEFNSRHRGQRDVLISADTLTKSRKQRMERERRMNSEGVYIPKQGAWRNQNFTNEEE